MESDVITGDHWRSSDPGVLESESELTLSKERDQDSSVMIRGEVVLHQQRIQHDGDALLEVVVVQEPEGLGQLDQ